MQNSGLTSEEVYLFHEGTYHQSYRKMGAHPVTEDGEAGVRFTVWAPNAQQVGLASDYNGWDGTSSPLERVPDSGLWTLFVPGLGEGTLYKYEILTAQGEKLLKSDPYAFHCEVKPDTASIVTALEGFKWTDRDWIKKRKPAYDRPLLIYEVNLSSWKKHEDGSYYTYTELADELVDYVADLGYTHIELLPLTEHPYDKSWGYQATGYFAATSRFGKPHELMHLINTCHNRGIGVIMDWVPGHFVRDAHGLRQFDGSPLYEHADPVVADRPGWGTLGFDYGKPEVQTFLISNALFWMDVYHIDGLRVDAVTSMIRHDFEKPPGSWKPNVHGGVENEEGIALLRKLNETVFLRYPNTLMMAEESSAWPLVTAPIEDGGLGFNYKWNMGWMNDTLKYAETDPIDRQHLHNLLTFPICYAFSENFVLPLSHDEVVHGKKSLLNKMPGDYKMKFAGLRAFLGYWMSFPGKKLLFMGSEFGQFDEWKDEQELDWFLLDEYDTHSSMLQYTKHLNQLYLQEKALWQLDHKLEGYEWIDHHDNQQNVIVYMRCGRAKGERVIIVCNFSPVERKQYRIGLPGPGTYMEILNSDDVTYGGEGTVTDGFHKAEKTEWHGRPYSTELTLPPMSVIWLKKAGRQETAADRKKTAAVSRTGTKTRKSKGLNNG
ncbi:1,4-alpha-glucan branching protein GlgB [Paenibacillus sambharensis]|uniref:1,4-alpha-glucan branching protein GlgB n=1 Tax=Paenibacillus sambharensis TaxID=1803190 RepID=UPI002482C415|nr:1,4-alpha-glucan branching protein GlgB [Paenibacillus sambharensis]